MGTYAITYPIDVPTSPVGRSVQVTARSAQAVHVSPFTFATKVYSYSGQAWQLDVTLPPMKRAAAEEWAAFFLRLDGRVGTFRMGVPGKSSARGSALGTPLIDGASQTGNELATKGWDVSETGVLLEGDYIQVGDQLFKVLEDVDSDGSGDAAVPVWPSLRSSPDDEAAITTASARGVWRMAVSEPGWNIELAMVHGFQFSAFEDVA